MAYVCCNTRCAADIIEAERSDKGVRFKKERQWLSNASTSAEDSNFGVPCGRGREGTGVGGESTDCRAGEHD